MHRNTHAPAHTPTYTQREPQVTKLPSIHPSLHPLLFLPSSHFEYISSHNETWTPSGCKREYEWEGEAELQETGKKGQKKKRKKHYCKKARRGRKAHHNGISTTSLGNKMKFFPKVHSVEVVMMDGWIWRLEKQLFFISPIQLKYDREWFSFAAHQLQCLPACLKEEEILFEEPGTFSFYARKKIGSLCGNEERCSEKRGNKIYITERSRQDFYKWSIYFCSKQTETIWGRKSSLVEMLHQETNWTLIFCRFSAFSCILDAYFSLHCREPK